MKATLVGVTGQSSTAPGQPAYRERLYTPWWWYIAALVVAVLLGSEVAVAIPTPWSWIVIGLLVLVSLAAVWRFSSGIVTVTATSLTVADATLPLTDIRRAIRLSPNELRKLVGRHSDPTALVFVRSWIGPGLQLVLRDAQPGDADSGDRVPYWVVSTRHPDRLLAALGAASVEIR